MYFVRLLQQQGRPLLPDITVLPVGPEAWQAGQPVYSEAVLRVLQAWLKSRRGRPPRPLSTCLSAKTAYFGALTLPAYEAESHAEVRLHVQQAVPLQQNLAFDYQAEPHALQQRVTYVAARQSEVSAIANYFQRAGCPLAALDLDVFALWRASLAVMPHLIRRETVALLWVGKASALFAVYQKGVVMASLAWSDDLPSSLNAFVGECAARVRESELAAWEVCAASSESADVVIAASRQSGLTPAFLDLMPYGHSHQALAHAFLAWGLALRGVTKR
jgi:Tfp pilus assembly PilM family ATPase